MLCSVCPSFARAVNALLVSEKQIKARIAPGSDHSRVVSNDLENRPRCRALRNWRGATASTRTPQAPHTVNSEARLGRLQRQRYVPHLVNESLDGKLELDRLLALLFKAARMQGLRLTDIQDRLRPFLALQPPDHFLVVDPDPELRRIIMSEVTECTGAQAIGSAVAECADLNLLASAIPVALPAQAKKVRAALPAHADLMVLSTRSVPESLQGQTPPASDSICNRFAGPFLRVVGHARYLGAGLIPRFQFRDARTRLARGSSTRSLWITTDS